MEWEPLLNLMGIAASTLLGSILGYVFAVRTTRRARLHEVKVAAYSTYLQRLGRLALLTKALSWALERPKSPGKHYENLAKAARVAFPLEAYQQLMEETRSKAERTAIAGQVTTETAVLRHLNPRFEEQVVERIYGTLIDLIQALESDEIVLRIIASKAIAGPELKELRQLFAMLAFGMMEIRKRPKRDWPELADKLLEELDESIRKVSNVVEAEIKETL